MKHHASKNPWSGANSKVKTIWKILSDFIINVSRIKMIMKGWIIGFVGH